MLVIKDLIGSICIFLLICGINSLFVHFNSFDLLTTGKLFKKSCDHFLGSYPHMGGFVASLYCNFVVIKIKYLKLWETASIVICYQSCSLFNMVL